MVWSFSSAIFPFWPEIGNRLGIIPVPAPRDCYFKVILQAFPKQSRLFHWSGAITAGTMPYAPAPAAYAGTTRGATGHLRMWWVSSSQSCPQRL